MKNEKIKKIVPELIDKQMTDRGYATIEDTLMMIGWLEQKNYLAWRNGKVPYLEKVCRVNLSKLSFLHKEYRKYAREHDYRLSRTMYRSYKQKKPLRFSKYGRKEVEEGYAMHIVKPKDKR